MARCIYTYEKVPHSQVCDMQLRELRQQGKTVKELAQLFSLSQRGVRKCLSRLNTDKESLATPQKSKNEPFDCTAARD